MIDIHSHILPSMDDGSESMDVTIAMAKEAVEMGITTMVATPHHFNGAYENEREKIESQTKRVNDVLQQENIPLEIVPGQEVRLYGEMIEDYKNEKVLPINDLQYLLIELPFGNVPAYTNQLLYDLQLEGITPIIAHPERNREILREPNKLFELINSGAVAQLTATSITEHASRNMRKVSEQMIEHHLIHFIASDAHNVTSRPNELQNAYNEIEKIFGPDVVNKMKENAEHVIAGEDILPERPHEIRKRGFFRSFRP